MNSFIKINDRNINYKIIGASISSEPLIVLLHDALGSIKQWGSFPEKISSEFNLPVLVFERFGHGYSEDDEIPKDQNLFIREAGYLHQLLESLNPKKIILIGSSDGGTIALQYASLFPQNVSAVVSMAAHVFVEDITVNGVLKTKPNSDKLINALKKYHSEKAEKLYCGWYDLWTSDGFRDWNMIGDLNKINCPVLALQGDMDEYGTVEQLSKIKNNVESECRIELIKNAGHFPYIDKENEVITLIKEFLSDKLA